MQRLARFVMVIIGLGLLLASVTGSPTGDRLTDGWPPMKIKERMESWPLTKAAMFFAAAPVMHIFNCLAMSRRIGSDGTGPVLGFAKGNPLTCIVKPFAKKLFY